MPWIGIYKATSYWAKVQGWEIVFPLDSRDAGDLFKFNQYVFMYKNTIRFAFTGPENLFGGRCYTLVDQGECSAWLQNVPIVLCLLLGEHA
jgi:hypothetical protein